MENDRSWVEIDLDAFRANIKELQRFMKGYQDFLQVVKADAYGHGAFEIAELALKLGAKLLGVANSEEGKLLRFQGIEAPILILSPSLPHEIDELIQYHLTPTISDLNFAKHLNHALESKSKTLNYHLKVDTGMHRSGFDSKELCETLKTLNSLQNIHLEGVMSHFASSENDTRFSLNQERLFVELLQSFEYPPQYFHIANSSALINDLGATGNLVRLGILSYGVYADRAQIDRIDLRPVMRFKSKISLIKSISKGDSCGYNRLWIAPADTTYAIVPIGYADGYDYQLGNKAHVEIAGNSYPVRGKVSMDMIAVELRNEPLVTGEVVTLLGGSLTDTKAEVMCTHYGGSPYELLCQIGRRARRYYYLDQKLHSSAPLSRRDFVPDDFSDSKLNSIIKTAVSQRLDSQEIGSLVYQELLTNLFFNKDSQIHYRKNFVHCIRLSDSVSPSHYAVETELSYNKILDHDHFLVACAQSELALEVYLKRKDVEYRWLMDDKFEINPDSFKISSVRINELILNIDSKLVDGCLELYCYHPELESLLGNEVSFVINTQTIYPKKSHQMSIFITELTKGVAMKFIFPEPWRDVECVPIFTGQNRFPAIHRQPGSIEIRTLDSEWTFPMSGVVFAY